MLDGMSKRKLLITNEVEQYILGFLLGDIRYAKYVSYSDEHCLTPIRIMPSKFFEESIYATPDSMPLLPLSQWENMPILYGKPVIEQTDNQLIIYADIVASSFFLMTRYEELINIENRDKYNRFIGKSSLPGRAGILERPIIDEYGKKLRELIRHQGIEIEEPSGNGKIYLTHDVDIPWEHFNVKSAFRYILSGLIKRHKFEIYPLLNLVGCYLINPHDTFLWMLKTDGDVKEKLGERCEDIYFIISNETRTNMTHSYINDKKADNLLLTLTQGASEIGLHIGFEAGINDSLEIKRKEKIKLEEKLGKKVTHSRNHYLLSNKPASLRDLIQIGITDDFTMGYADTVGFRLGTSKCVRWIDPENMEVTSLKLHPLNVMDNTLYAEQYLGLDKEGAYNKIEMLYRKSQESNGDFCILFHNSVFKNEPNNWVRDVYEETMQLLKSDI